MGLFNKGNKEDSARSRDERIRESLRRPTPEEPTAATQLQNPDDVIPAIFLDWTLVALYYVDAGEKSGWNEKRAALLIRQIQEMLKNSKKKEFEGMTVEGYVKSLMDKGTLKFEMRYVYSDGEISKYNPDDEDVQSFFTDIEHQRERREKAIAEYVAKKGETQTPATPTPEAPKLSDQMHERLIKRFSSATPEKRQEYLNALYEGNPDLTTDVIMKSVIKAVSTLDGMTQADLLTELGDLPDKEPAEDDPLESRPT